MFFPWNTSKSSISPFGEARTKTLRPVGFGFPLTNCLTGHLLVKGIICSSMHTFGYLGRLRHPSFTRFSRGLSFQGTYALFSSSVKAKSSTIFKEVQSLKYLSLDILSLISGTHVLLAQNIATLGNPRQAMWIDIPKNIFSSCSRVEWPSSGLYLPKNLSSSGKYQVSTVIMILFIFFFPGKQESK